MKYKAVLFDLDGTLLDTLEDLADSMNYALRQCGFPEHDLAAYKIFVGDGVYELARRALPKSALNDVTIQKCVAGMRAEYDKRWANKTRLYDGMADLLDGLTSQKIKMAVLSNKPDDFTKLVVSKFLSGWNFAFVAGARESKPKKPDPAVALEIAEELRIPPSEFLYLGDTNTDMQTANSAGMYAVGVLWGFRTAAELSANGAKILIEKPVDLLRFL